MKIKTILLALVLAQTAVSANAGQSADSTIKNQEQPINSEVNDAWLKGKVEMALLLNTYLNSFRINTQVNEASVSLSGEVESEIDRDLAEQIALGIDGVDEVQNKLQVEIQAAKRSKEQDGHRPLIQRIEDLTLAARVKSRLALNQNVSATEINVDTRNSIVTLEGQVDSGQEIDLAVKIAQNTTDVVSVDNKLSVSRPAS